MSPADLLAALRALARRRPVFHSEADFQHELAWLLRERSGAEVRLERPFYREAEPINLDLLLLADGARVGVELKYWKRGAPTGSCKWSSSPAASPGAAPRCPASSWGA